MILVAGDLTLPLAFDDHMADAKKKKSYKKHSSKKKYLKKTEIEAVGGHGGSGGAGGISAGGSSGSSSGGTGGSSTGGAGGCGLQVAQVLYWQLLVVEALVTQAEAGVTGGAGSGIGCISAVGVAHCDGELVPQVVQVDLTSV